MEHAQSAILRLIGNARGGTVARNCACIMVCALIAGTSAAQQETLGSILDKGAKKMSRAEVTAAMKKGMLGSRLGSGDMVVHEISYEPDGGMTGTHDAAGVIRAEWRVDDEGLQCVDWFGGGTDCNYWYKLGDSIYIIDAELISDRDQVVQPH